MVAVLLCIVGLVGYLSLSVREYPDTDPPIVSVETTYIGAAASVVETRITQILEDSVAGVQGIQNITSTSRDGTSTISIEFDPSRDIDSAANDVRDRVGAVTEDLPEDALALVIRGGAGAAARQSIGVVVVFGVSLATLITLFLIPILYSRVARRTVSPQTVSRRLDSALKDSPEAAE